MHFTKSILLVSALSAGSTVARATHKHRHQRFHEERAIGDMVTATIDGVAVSWANTYGGPTAAAAAGGAADAVSPPEAAATPTAAAVAAPAPAAAAPAAPAAAKPAAAAAPASDDSGVASSYVPFCNGNAKRATDEEISYVGNTGGSDYGCNIMEVASSIADQYTYTATFTGDNSSPWTLLCFNKIGPDGKIDGWYGHAAITTTLAPGEKKTIAFDANSQGSCTAAEGDSIPTDAYGGYAATWFEFDFGDAANGGWSGADVSSIQAEAAGLTVQPMKACSGSTCSTIAPGGAATNAFTEALKYADGLGMNLPAGKVAIDVTIAYSG